jgi:uncharacterized repeat protein (TIGR01451 family)
MKARLLFTFCVLLISLGLVVMTVTVVQSTHPGPASTIIPQTNNYPPVESNAGGWLEPASLTHQRISAPGSMDNRAPAPVSGYAQYLELSKNAKREPALTRQFVEGTSGDVAAFSSYPSFEGGIFGLGLTGEGVTVDPVQDRIWGFVDPGAIVTVLRPADGAYGASAADGQGFFWTSLFTGDGSGEPVELFPGELFELYVDGSLEASLSPYEIAGAINVLSDQASGVISGIADGEDITLSVGFWNNWPGDAAIMMTTTVTTGGAFSASLPIDLGAENFIVVDAPVTGGYVRGYLYPDPAVFLVEQYNLVAGYAPRNQNVHVTVYISYPDEVRWEGDAWAGHPHGWYFLSDVDVAPGDLVELTFEDSTVISAQVADLGNFNFDAELDRFTGYAPAGSTVRANMYQQGSKPLYVETFAIANIDGEFLADFAPADLRPRDWVDVVVTDGFGNQTMIVSGPPYLQIEADPFSEIDCITGRVDGPGLEVSLTLQIGDDFYTRERPFGPSDVGNYAPPYGGCALIWGWDWGPIDIIPGSIVTLSSDSWSGSMTMPEFSWMSDPETNQVSGSAPPGQVEITAYRFRSDNFPVHASDLILVDSLPDFNAEFGQYDLREGDELTMRYFEPDNGFSASSGLWRYPVQVIQVHVPYGLSGASRQPYESLTAVLYDEFGSQLAYSDYDHDGHPMYFWMDFSGVPILTGHKIVMSGSSGWQTEIEIPDFTVQADQATNMVSGQAPTGALFVEGDGPMGGYYALFIPVDGYPSGQYSLNPGIFGHQLNLGDWIAVHHQNLSGSRVRREYRIGELFRVELWTEPGGRTWFWGEAQPGSEVTITIPGEVIVVTADPGSGGWGTHPVLLQEGDPITVAAGDGLYPVSFNIPDPYITRVDTDLDQVFGQAGGWDSVMIEVHGWWEDGYQEIWTDANGSFMANYLDIPPGGNGYIRAQFNLDLTDLIFHRAFIPVQPVLNVNYTYDWVNGSYEPGHTIVMEVRDSLGDLKASTTLLSGPVPWWDNTSGFDPQEDDWIPEKPDLFPGDQVEVRVDDEYSASLKIGAISGDFDYNFDTLSGTIDAPWLSGPLSGNCSVWEEGGPSIDFEVDPDNGPYLCDFNSVGWDLQLGQYVAVAYREPDAHWIQNSLHDPAPVLGIWTWGEGNPTTEGNFSFVVHYRNWGDGEAQNVKLTSVLDGGLVYLGDTLGIDPTGSGTPEDPLVWEIGDLPPDNQTRQFFIFAEVTASVGETVTHTIQIENGYPYYQGNWWDLQHTWSTQVMENDTHLNIGKGAWTWNPIPGSEFVYNVNVCNNGATSSSIATLTDDLPEQASLLYWWARESGWQEVSQEGNQIVLSIPTISGWSCREVFYRVSLDSDVEPDTELYNRAEIEADNDMEIDDNVAHLWHNIGNPNYVSRDLAIWKDWHYGETVPGGYMRYEVGYRNHGQVPISGVRITETLPANATFIRALYWDYLGEHDFPPSEVIGDEVIWDLGTLDNGYGGNFAVDLAISSSANPGDLLENRFDITRPWGDERWDNNQIVWIDRVNQPGPNLHLYTRFDWHWKNRLSYEIRIHNYGTEWLENVCVSDIHPELTIFNGDYNFGHGPWSDFWYDPDTRTLVFCVSHLSPGESASAGFRVDLDEEVYDVPGLAFVNRLEGYVEGDVYPEDNVYESTAYTGPDIYVFSELLSGEPRAGEEFTLAVQFGNQNRWPWNSDENMGSSITLTLPTELEYVFSSHPYNTLEAWDPEQVGDNTFHWEWGPMWSESNWVYFLTLRVKDGIEGGQPLPVTLAAYGDNPDEVEPFWDNNTHTLDLETIGPAFQVSKVFESSEVAGMPVIYTLSTLNTGNDIGTGVELVDQLPGLVTYVGGADTFEAGLATWNIPLITAGESIEAEFWGTLSCTAGGVVNNQSYRVEDSDQGISSPDGPAVSFTIAEPAISVSFTPSSTDARPGQEIAFIASASTNGTALSYAWDFGDGTTASGETAAHSFSQVGSYTVTLTVTDECGFSTAYQVSIDVTQPYLFLPVILR